MTQELLTVREVMKILKVSRRTIYYWIDDGILKPVRIGSVYRFHPDDIEILIDKNRPMEVTRKKRLLAIDDDLLVRESLKAILVREGIEATVVSSGKEAIRILGKEVFDLIMTDVRMPEMNGIETLRQIRELRKKAGKEPLPEIVLTAYDDEVTRREAEELGVKHFILKPFELKSFLTTIRASFS